ncbi:MAG: hypothetical protein HY819_10095 [Acidobacteria bacterium]|nr:hypothetical protein [Acidobacteriota bacterium]
MVSINSSASLANNSLNDNLNNCATPNNGNIGIFAGSKAQYSDCAAKEVAMQQNICSTEAYKQPYDPNCNPYKPQPEPKPYQNGNACESYVCNPYAQMMKQKMQEQCKPQICNPEPPPQVCNPPQTETCKPQEQNMDKAKECYTKPVETPVEKPVDKLYKELNKTLKGLEKQLDKLISTLGKEDKLISKLENISKKLDDLISKLGGSKTPATPSPAPPTEPPPVKGDPVKDNPIKEKLGELFNQIKSLISEIETLLKGGKPGDVKKPNPTPAPDKDVKTPESDFNQQALKLVLEALELAISAIKQFAKPEDLVTKQSSNMWNKMQIMA